MNKVEFKVLELDVPIDVLALAADPEVRSKINLVIENALNEHGEDGWQLHTSGLTSMPTVILVREIPRTRKTPNKKGSD